MIRIRNAGRRAGRVAALAAAVAAGLWASPVSGQDRSFGGRWFGGRRVQPSYVRRDLPLFIEKLRLEES